MTIAEAISRVDAIKPNRFRQEQKLEWLENIEGQVYREIVLPNENPEGIAFSGFASNVDPGTQLIAPKPYDEVYILYLQCQIDRGNMEEKKYNNSMLMFNAAYMQLKNYWQRTHMPLQAVTHFRF